MWNLIHIVNCRKQESGLLIVHIPGDAASQRVCPSGPTELLPARRDRAAEGGD